VIDVRDLGRQPGAIREVQIRLPAPAGLGSDLLAVPQGAPLAVRVSLEAVLEGIWVSGTVSAPQRGECARCLAPLATEAVVNLEELYAYPGSTTATTTDEDEVSRIIEDTVDLEPLLRDSVLLALPLSPLCRPDCPGLCPDCGEHLDRLPPGHVHRTVDPRWAALRERIPEAAPARAAPAVQPERSPTT